MIRKLNVFEKSETTEENTTIRYDFKTTPSGALLIGNSSADVFEMLTAAGV